MTATDIQASPAQDPWDDEPDVEYRPSGLPASPVRATIGVLTAQRETTLTHQQRGDAKVAPLAGAAAAVVAAVVTGNPAPLDTWAGIAGLAVYAGIVATVAITLWAVRPSLRGDVGVVRLANATPVELVSAAGHLAMDPEDAMRTLAEEIQLHARIAVTRYRRIRWSTDLGLATLALAAAARVLTMAGW